MKKTIKTLTGTITELTYVDTSTMGNSRYSCQLEGHIVQSAPNCSLALVMQNFEGKKVIAEVKELRGKLVFESLKLAPADEKQETNKSYIQSQFEKIVTPNQNHIAGILQIKGDCGGATNWLNVSAKDLKAIQAILENSTRNNSGAN